jgi:hypothetical protein
MDVPALVRNQSLKFNQLGLVLSRALSGIVKAFCDVGDLGNGGVER